MAAFSSSVFSPEAAAAASVDMKRDGLGGGRLLAHDCAMAADAADDDDDGANGALVKNADANAGPLLTTARRIPADDMKRSIHCFETIKTFG